MRSANAANGAKGAGKKSAAGLIASSLNSTKHGMSCKTLIFLADEDQSEFWADVDRRVAERGVTSIEERDLVVTVAYSRWVNRRVINATAAAINEERADILDRFKDGDVKQTRDLIDRIPTEPDLAVDELSKSTRGCMFLLKQFEFLRERLQAYLSFEIGQRREALRLGCHRPEELFKDRDVIDLNRCSLGGILVNRVHRRGSRHAGTTDPGLTYTEFVRMLEPHVKDIPSFEGQEG
jgi:hypothetical protein